MSDGAAIWANRNSGGPKVTQQFQGSEWVLSVAFQQTDSKRYAISMNPRLFGEGRWIQNGIWKQNHRAEIKKVKMLKDLTVMVVLFWL